MLIPNNRDKQVRRVILIEGAANLVVLLTKLVVGFSTGSMAILSDAVHSLTDIMNNVIAWFVIRYSSMPPDRQHPYGHRKFETLAVFILATLLTVLAIELAINAIRRQQMAISHNNVGLALMVGVLLVNISVTIWQRRWARRLSSDILLADANHTLADVLITSVVIIGWQLSARGYAWLDTACALVVASLVLYLAYGLFRRAIPILVDQVAIDPDLLMQSIESVDGIREIKRLRSRLGGMTQSVDMVVTVDPHLSTTASHDITDEIENRLKKQFGIRDITIHVEPVNGHIPG